MMGGWQWVMKLIGTSAKYARQEACSMCNVMFYSAMQNSTLHSIRAGSQAGWLTAQAKTEPNVPGGFVFKYCRVDGGKTFLGRAWNSDSTVVFYNTYMAGNVVPEGWDAWRTGDNK